MTELNNSKDEQSQVSSSICVSFIRVLLKARKKWGHVKQEKKWGHVRHVWHGKKMKALKAMRS